MRDDRNRTMECQEEYSLGQNRPSGEKHRVSYPALRACVIDYRSAISGEPEGNQADRENGIIQEYQPGTAQNRSSANQCSRVDREKVL